MLESSTRSLGGLFRASLDVALATAAGGLVLFVFYPLTLCASGVKGALRLAGRQPSPHALVGDEGDGQRRQTQERAERQFVRGGVLVGSLNVGVAQNGPRNRSNNQH